MVGGAAVLSDAVAASRHTHGVSDPLDNAVAKDIAELEAARAARRARERELTPAQRLVRLDALIRQLATLKAGERQR